MLASCLLVKGYQHFRGAQNLRLYDPTVPRLHNEDKVITFFRDVGKYLPAESIILVIKQLDAQNLVL